jgi:PAS domain S-box-containing protein
VLSGLVAAAVGIAAARWLAAPTRALSRASERLAAEDLSAPLPVSSITEVAGLVLAFGEMRDRLAARTAEREQLLAEARRQAEELRQSEERFRFVATNIPDTLFFQDEELRYVWIFNPADPLAEGEVVGKTDADLLPPEEAERLTEIKRRVLETGTGTRVELQLSPGGITRWYEAVYEPSRDFAGRIVGVVSYTRDTTERKLAEETLRKSEERLRTMADAVPQLVWMAQPDGFIYWYNRRWYEYTGTTPEQMEGWGWQSVHDPEMLPKVLERWQLSIVTGEPFDMEFPLRSADGRFRWFLTRIVPLKDSAGRVLQWFGTNTDISERREAEEERERLLVAEKEARSTAEQAVKVRDEFISVAAHELKTPVTSLQGYAQLITRQFDRTGTLDPERVVKALRQVQIQSGKLSQLTEQLLDLSRLESGRLVLAPKEVDLSSLVQGVVDAVQHAHPERVLELLNGDPLAASVDPLRIEQVVTNLLDNAVKFSPHGSPVVAEIATAGDGWAEIAVRDYGIGIPQEKLEHIFDAFYQAHPERHLGGMGIGLHIGRQMVEMHGGSIRVEQPPDGGSRFVVRLPLVGHDNDGRGDDGRDG